MEKKKRKKSTFKTISVKLDMNNKEQRMFFNILYSLNMNDRSDFVFELYKRKQPQLENINQNEMSIYEKKMFDLIEIAIKTKQSVVTQQQPVMVSPSTIPTSFPKPIKNSSGIKTVTSAVNYDNIDIGGNEEPEEVDYDKLLDNQIEEGLK